MACEGATSGAGGEDVGRLEDLLQHLDLKGDELDDVVVGAEEVKGFSQAARWLANGKVITNKPFSASALFEMLKFTWGLVQTPKCREAEENIFIFHMFCLLGYWKKVVHKGPWIFRGLWVMIEDYDGRTDLSSVVFDGLYVWAQIHKIWEIY